MPACLNAKHCFRSALFGLLICLFLTSQAWAAAYTWDGGAGTDNWVDGDNWDPNIAGWPVAGDDVTFATSETVFLGASREVRSLTIEGTAANMTFDGRLQTTTLTVDGGTSITVDGVGIIQLGIVDSFVYGANDVVFNGTGTFYFQAANAISSTGSIELDNDAAFAISADQTIRMPDTTHGADTHIILLSPPSVLTIYHTGASLNYQGRIQGYGGIQIQGGGTVALSGTSNSYTGSTTVSVGRLIVTSAGNLPAETGLTVNSTGTCEVGNQTVSSIAGSGTIDINAGDTLTVDQAGNTTFGGDITGGVGSNFTKTGAGALTLNGTVAPPVQINNGTLLGTGACYGALDIAAGTTFGPGNSVGTFTCARLNMAALSYLDIEVNGATGDQVIVNGAPTPVNLTNPVLSISGTPTPGASYLIIDNQSGDPINGIFDMQPEGSLIEGVGGYFYRITYVSGDGNDVVLTSLAPEMDVRGNSVSIANGDATPASAYHTDFGNVSVTVDSKARTFTIANTGDLDLWVCQKGATMGCAVR